MITREATLERSDAGFPRRVQLVGLPLTLDDSSVRVEVESSAAGPIAGDLRVTIAVPDEEPELPPPTNDELDRAQLELELAIETRDQKLAAKQRLAGLQPGARGRPEEGKPPAASPTAARLELLGFRRERVELIERELEQANERVRELEEQLASLRERERVASSHRNARTYELRKAAVLELDQIDGAPAAQRAIVRLHYFVPGARWAPSYTLRLDRAMRSASFEMRAMIGQSTGEDWHDVALTLSTASPQQWTELPELRSRRIGRRQPPPAKTGWRPPPVGADELYADYDRGLGQASVDLEDEPADEQFDLAQLEQPAPPPPPAPPAFVPPPQSMTRAGTITPEGMEMMARMRESVPPSAGAPPMPARAPSAPEQSYAMPVAAAPKRSAGLGSIVGGIADGLASAFGSDAPYMDEAGGGGAMAPMLEPELVAGRELLDYGRLRMYPASSSLRGSLKRIDLRMQYQQWTTTSIRIDVAIKQITEALEWAKLLDTESPPEGHSWPHSEGGFDFAYVAEAPIDLPSTGAFVSLPIEHTEAEAKARYVSVPRETQDVFRIVSLRNPLSAPLLPGPADVYVAGKFALTSAVELTPIGGRIELGLGVEQAIKIARNVKFEEDSSGMFKRQLALRHTIEVEVQNHLQGPALVEVRERVPIAAEAQKDDIAITIENVAPAWDDYEPPRPGQAKLEGGRVWSVDVPAAGKRELSATWIVKIPVNHELIGGNRRES